MEKPQCQQVCIVAAQKKPGLGAAVEMVWNASEVFQDRLANSDSMEESILNQELIKAAREGRDDDLNWCLQNGAFVDTRRPFTIAFHNECEDEEDDADVGLTPLMYAALGGYSQACRVLLSAGACVDSEDEDKMQPLHFAATSGSIEVFTLLLQAKANPWAQDSKGHTALHYLASDEHKDPGYHARPALKALLSMIAATPAPDNEADQEEDGCTIPEELLESSSQAESEACSFRGDAGSDDESEHVEVEHDKQSVKENIRQELLESSQAESEACSVRGDAGSDDESEPVEQEHDKQSVKENIRQEMLESSQQERAEQEHEDRKHSQNESEPVNPSESGLPESPESSSEHLGVPLLPAP